ncbi:hypothetical protein [Bacteroides sp. 51]|uniref:hypothetical protein n=1 Tax=Bacteroides sp. 51 TaxID=2302938 RepID=UPI0013D58510|nr:hypothetical protein [Bacteroides sp. 51]NDV80838.1 hypothetical protein [Bacteroides sp. 51]
MDISSVDVLSCHIRIGDADADNPIKIKNPIEITEVSEIEIHESYKKLIGTAKITLPKGSIYKSTVIGAITLEGVDASLVTTEIMQDGVIIEKRAAQTAVNENTFKVGQRINIKLGYNGVLKNMFDGYITAYNSDSNFQIDCENMAYKLKLKQAPKLETPIRGTKINDLLGEKYSLLKDTGFKLHGDTKKFDIEIGKVKVTDNFTVADILNEWSKYKVYCFLKYDSNSEDEMPSIAVGRPYSSSKNQPVFPDEATGPYQIRFDYHVASNDLKVLKVDPKFLAVTGKALGVDEKFFEVTIRLNPEYDPSSPSSKEFQTINATQISKKTHKITGNTTAEGAKTKTKVDLSTYTVVPYMSTRMGISSDELAEETIEYFRSYNLNGITGSVTIFGDFGLPTAVQIELVDDRNPSKNGIYLVDEVTTTFGTNGYRQKLSLPYKIRGSKSTYGEGK